MAVLSRQTDTVDKMRRRSWDRLQPTVDLGEFVTCVQYGYGTRGVSEENPNIHEVYHTQNEPTREVTEWSHGRPGTVLVAFLLLSDMFVHRRSVDE